MIFTFSVDTGDAPDAGRKLVDAAKRVTSRDALDTASREWQELVDETGKLLLEWGDKLAVATGSWAEWMVSR